MLSVAGDYGSMWPWQSEQRCTSLFWKRNDLHAASMKVMQLLPFDAVAYIDAASQRDGIKNLHRICITTDWLYRLQSV